MPFNRINGFFVGAFHMPEKHEMTIEERNSELNQSLESRLNQLNSAIEQQEKELKSMMVARDTFFCYRTGDELDGGRPVGEHSWYVGMIRLKGGWRLCHAAHYFHYQGFEEDIEWKPLVECSIEERIEAAPHIEKLREAIVESKEKLMPELEQAISSLAKQANQPPRGTE
jgi:hypothetical protein